HRTVVVVERHVAALGSHHCKAAENGDASDDQNPQAHHRLPYKVRISYALKPAPGPFNGTCRGAAIYFTREKETLATMSLPPAAPFISPCIFSPCTLSENRMELDVSRDEAS